MPDLFLIAGLGNPGPEYAETRHNAGFWFIDELARRQGIAFRTQGRLKAETARTNIHGQDCLFMRPTCFMNHSGQAVAAVMNYYGLAPARLLVAYDELDLPAGKVRLKLDGGHGGHNGLRDILRHVPERAFLRLRIGIGHPGTKDAVTNYVLSRPSAMDEQVIRQGISSALAVLPEVLNDQLPRAMKVLHTEADGV